MKRILLMSLACAALAVLPSCESTKEGGGGSVLGSTAMKLADAGLLYAAATNKIQPGDMLTIKDGLATIRSEGTWEEKTSSLVDLGIAHMVREGKLQEGDILLIEESQAILKRPVESDPLPDPPAAVFMDVLTVHPPVVVAVEETASK